MRLVRQCRAPNRLLTARRALNRRKWAADLGLYRVDDLLLEAWGVLGGQVKKNCRPHLIAPLLEDSLGADIPGHVVAVAVDPDPRSIQFTLQAQGVVDDQFPSQENHRQVAPE